MFYFPGLSSRPWHDPASFPWCKEMENNVPAVRAEYENLVHRKVYYVCVKLPEQPGGFLEFLSPPTCRLSVRIWTGGEAGFDAAK